MNIVLRSAAWGIAANPLRSLALAIALASAAASVIFSASVRGGFSKDLERMAFGGYATTLVIRPNAAVESRHGGPSLDDQARLAEELPDVEAVAAWIVAQTSIRSATETLKIPVFGASGDYRREVDADLIAGRWLDEQEIGGLQRACLVGASLADDLGHDNLSLLDRSLTLGGASCKVVGVLDYAKTRPAGQFNEGIIAPFQTVHRYFARTSSADFSHPREASWLSFFMADDVNMEDVRFQADRQMRKMAGIGYVRDSPYMFDNPSATLIEQVKQKTALSKLLTTMTTGTLIASLIGYAGIALSTTASRTREIALRMAMGARRKDILLQISSEHLLIGFMASLCGLAIGYSISAVVSKLWEWPINLSLAGGALAIAIGLGVGICVGLVAAIKAVNTPPSLAAKT